MGSQREAENSPEEGRKNLFQNTCNNIPKYTVSLLSIYTSIDVETSRINTKIIDFMVFDNFTALVFKTTVFSDMTSC